MNRDQKQNIDSSRNSNQKIYKRVQPISSKKSLKTKKLATIDYEVSRVSDIYKDFCPYCFSNLALEFLKDTICFYNQISSKEEKPLHIDIEKAKLFWQVAQFCELARCAQETGPLSYEQQLKKFKDFQKKIISLEKPTRTSPIIQQAYSLEQR